MAVVVLLLLLCLIVVQSELDITVAHHAESDFFILDVNLDIIKVLCIRFIFSSLYL